MKMKLNDILMLNNALKIIIDNDNASHSIDAVFKFRLLGIIKNLELPIANFEVIRDEKIREYGTEDESGNISISPDDKDTIKKFTNELNKVLESDVEINIEKLKAKTVFESGISADQLVRLYDIIEE